METAQSNSISAIGDVFETDVPARLDRLPWTSFHTLVVIALGITWILDGLEVTLAGSLAAALKSSPSLRFTDAQIGLSASLYLIGAVAGALMFGWLTDRFGRKRMFNVTLGLYLMATALTAFSSNFWTFALFRILTGAGIGGEYSAINSAIQELIPARYRGRTDLIVNGSYWIGAAIGAFGSVVLLAPGLFPADIGWRVAFGIGATLGLAILYLRRFLPESPRWLMTHGRVGAAESLVREIERRLKASGASVMPVRIQLVHRRIGMVDVMRTLFKTYPQRSLLCLVLMGSQAFFYNAIFFTYALVLSRYFHIADDRIGLYILPFAVGNFLGPLFLGRLFDTVGRKAMIASTYALSGLLLTITAILFANEMLDVVEQTIAWSIVFFFASAAASSAYLTIGEAFPLEMRAMAIAIFYSLGTLLGGAVAPFVFSLLTASGERRAIAWGYLFGAVLMFIGAAFKLKLGVAAERRPLEEVARPLSSPTT